MTLRAFRSGLGRTAALALCMGLGACGTLDTIGDWFGSKEKPRVPGERIALMARGQDVIGQDVAFVGKALPVPGPTPVAQWSQPGGNAENLIGNTDGSVNFDVAWTAHLPVSTSASSAITASPVTGGGMIFALDAAANVSAFDIQTGGVVWQASLAVGEAPSDFYFFSSAGDSPDEGFGGGLAYADSRLFVNTGFGEIVALDARSGGRIWSKKVETPFHTSPTVRDGRVYTMNRDNRAWALDAATGAELWTHEVFAETASILASVSPAASSELVLVPYTNGDIYALRANNGRPVWFDTLTRTGQADSLSAINDIAGRPVLDGNLAFVVSHAGRLVGIDIFSGERIWTRDIAGVQTPVVAGDFLYVVAMDGNLMAIEKRSGRIAWIANLGRWKNEADREDPVEWSGPLMAQGNLVLVSTDGRMAIVTASTGAVVATYSIGTGSIIAPITAGGTIFTLDEDGRLIAYR